MTLTESALGGSGKLRTPANGSSPESRNGHASQTVRVMLLMSTSLDCESLSALLSTRRGIELVGSSPDLDFGLARCRQLRPKLLILDPRIDRQAVALAVATMHSGHVEHMIVLDDRVHEGLVAELLPQPRVSYMTRRAGAETLYAAVVKSAICSMRGFRPDDRPPCVANVARVATGAAL